jgi:hypothetical protein
VKRIIHTGLPYEVINTKLPGQEGGPPVDAKIIRFIDGDTLLDFPMAQEDWDELKAMGDGTGEHDPRKKVEIVKAMPEVLKQRPQGGPRPPR